MHDSIYHVYLLISRTFLPGIWPVFFLRLIRTTCPEGQSFRMSEQILWTDVHNDTHDTDEEDEDDTYNDLPYL